MTKKATRDIRRRAGRFAGLGAGFLPGLLVLATNSFALADALPTELARFSESAGLVPPAWKPLAFPKIKRHTRYQMTRSEEGASWVVEAVSDASASGLTHECAIDLRERPILRWRWKVAGVLARGDARRKDGDDYAARVYLTFEPGREELSFWERTSLALARKIYGDVPARAINYVWASRLERGASVDSAYVGGFVKLVAVESGSEEAGRWRSEERDVFADYRALFGTDPPAVTGVAIMTDSDDTEGSVRAWFGDIEFVTREQGDR